MNNRRELACGKEIWVIKAGFPNTSTKEQWSDYVFANTMKKYLERSGCYVVVESRDEWENEEPADVVVSLRGPYAYYPDRSKNCIYIMWNLSHPSTVTDEEYNSFDLVCIGSEKETYLDEIKSRVHVPVKSLPMCVDTELFYPDEDPYGEKEYDWIFVGNSRYQERKSVLWAIEHKIPLKIWGAGWEKFITDIEKYVVKENIPNNVLPDLYRNAKITINDHYDDMINNGFINTRILEALACGLPVISDYSEVLIETFGDAILYYRTEEEFVFQIETLRREYIEVKKRVMMVWQLIKERYSFEQCMKSMCKLKDEIVAYEIVCKEEVKLLSYGQGTLENDKIAQFYRKFLVFLNKLSGAITVNPKSSFADVEKEWEALMLLFTNLTWREQKAFGELTGVEKFVFQVYVQNQIDVEKMQKTIDELLLEKGKLQGIIEDDIKESERKKEEFIKKLQDAYQKNRETNEKLQKTYAEKSEINRKLQITYDEKYNRGLEIKQLKKELESIKNSKCYKLSRIIGLPIRWFRKIISRK